jgi:hypothetical protein
VLLPLAGTSAASCRSRTGSSALARQPLVGSQSQTGSHHLQKRRPPDACPPSWLTVDDRLGPSRGLFNRPDVIDRSRQRPRRTRWSHQGGKTRLRPFR